MAQMYIARPISHHILGSQEVMMEEANYGVKVGQWFCHTLKLRTNSANHPSSHAFSACPHLVNVTQSQFTANLLNESFDNVVVSACF